MIHDPSLPLKHYKDQIEGTLGRSLFLYSVFHRCREAHLQFVFFLANARQISRSSLCSRHWCKTFGSSKLFAVSKVVCEYCIHCKAELFPGDRPMISALHHKSPLCFQVSDKAALLYRQYVKDSLYDRISTRPFLNPIEKKWLAFQLLCALNQCHHFNVSADSISFQMCSVRRVKGVRRHSQKK